MMMIFKKKGFTLVEMMIVIIIIGVLAAALIPKIMAVQSRARDLQRRVDLIAISNALMLYYTEHLTFPPSSCNAPADYVANVEPRICQWSNPGATTGYRTFGFFTGFLPELEGSYLKSIPQDPQYPHQSYGYYFEGTMFNPSSNYIRLKCNTNFNFISWVTAHRETLRPDDIVSSCPNGMPWNYVAHGTLNKYRYQNHLRIYDDKYAPIGNAPVPGGYFDKDT